MGESNYVEESIVSLSHLQGGSNIASSSNSSSKLPLGLTLHITQPFLNTLQRSVNKARDEKVQAANLPATFIKIGNWQRRSEREGDLTAKIYYAKRKLIWEVLQGPIKNKIEMDWSHILSIRAITPTNEIGTLEIELKHVPQFFKEMNPQITRHTVWDSKPIPDFTTGAASLYRKHIVSFEAGILDEPYAKLLRYDGRLFDLSQKPFPKGNPTFSDN